MEISLHFFCRHLNLRQLTKLPDALCCYEYGTHFEYPDTTQIFVLIFFPSVLTFPVPSDLLQLPLPKPHCRSCSESDSRARAVLLEALVCANSGIGGAWVMVTTAQAALISHPIDDSDNDDDGSWPEQEEHDRTAANLLSLPTSVLASVLGQLQPSGVARSAMACTALQRAAQVSSCLYEPSSCLPAVAVTYQQWLMISR